MAAKPCNVPPLMTKVEIELLVGDRLISTFMSNAGLGISGVGVVHRYELTYREGEFVTPQRVMATIDTMRRHSDAENTGWRASCPRVLSIKTFFPGLLVKRTIRPGETDMPS